MSENKNLPAESKNNKISTINSIQQGNIIQSALNNLTEVQRQELMGVAAKEALNLEVQHRQRQARHDTARESISDHIHTFHSLDKNGRTIRHNLTSDVETGAGKMRIESKSGASCFVATVVFGNEDHYVVQYLRCYRDNILADYMLGRRFIAWYYNNGPKIAKYVTNKHVLKVVIKMCLKTFVILTSKTMILKTKE